MVELYSIASIISFLTFGGSGLVFWSCLGYGGGMAMRWPSLFLCALTDEYKKFE